MGAYNLLLDFVISVDNNVQIKYSLFSTAFVLIITTLLQELSIKYYIFFKLMMSFVFS